MKTNKVISSPMGKSSGLIFLLTSILTVLWGIYILYISISYENGTIIMKMWEIRELILNETLALILSIGGTLLMDIEEKNEARR